MNKKLLGSARMGVGIFALIFVLIPTAGYAQVDPNNPKNNPLAEYTLLEPLPCIPSPASTDGKIPAVTCKDAYKTEINFGDYVQYMFNLVIAISAVMAVLILVWGGFKYVTTDSFQGKSDGKKVIMQALQGLLLVLCSYIILRTIDPRLVAIPSTIVTPLNITDDMKTSTSDLFSSLSKFAASTVEQDMAKLKGDTTALRHANNAISQQIKDTQVERNNIISQIKELTGAKTDTEVFQQCINSFADVKVSTLCTLLQGNRNKEQQLTGIYSVNLVTAKMNINIRNSNALNSTTGLTKADLHTNIDRDLETYKNLLRENGQVQLIPQIEDYAAYSKSMVNIFSTIAENSQWNWVVVGALDTAQNYIRDAATITGVVAGGGLNPVTGAVGYVAGNALGNATVNAIKNNVNKNDAARSVSSIQAEVNSVVAGNKIRNPATLAKYKEQAYALIKSLGGKGDGTDKAVAPTLNQNEYPVDFGSSY